MSIKEAESALQNELAQIFRQGPQNAIAAVDRTRVREAGTIDIQVMLPLPRNPPGLEEWTMLEISKIIRSKNSGLFESTLGIMFDAKDAY
ncbi:hypothetical protein N7486_006096 [Penicillium sp. IBT 16267x]|nr:hypothetical protein N7486_006096 [Penicillium sp. IBT 16267x]